jgi:hypothetical protein
MLTGNRMKSIVATNSKNIASMGEHAITEYKHGNHTGYWGHQGPH